MGAGDVRAGEFRVGEFRIEEVRAGEVRAGEVRDGEVRADELRAVEVRAGRSAPRRDSQLCAIEVDDSCVAVICRVAGSDDGEGGLDISRGKARWSYRLLRPTERIADEGAEYRDDGGLVAGGVLHEALQRVDAAEPDLDGVGAEVGNSGVVPVGDLSLFGGNLSLPGDLHLGLR